MQHGFDTRGIGSRLIANRGQSGNALAERGFGRIERAAFNGVVEALEAHVRFGRTLVQFGDMLAAPRRSFLPAIEQRGENVFDPLRVKQALFDMADHHAVELVHGDRASLAAGIALPRPDGAGIVAVATVLAGAQRHGPTAVTAIADAREQVRAAHDTGRRDLRVVGPQALFDGLEGLALDKRGHLNGHDLLLRLQFPGLGPLVELMLADIGATRQHAMKLADAPAPAVAGEDAVPVQMIDDGLHAHRAGLAVPFQGKAVDQPHRVGVERIDFQLLLGLGPALLGGDGAITDRR